MDMERDERGKFSETVANDELLAVFETTDLPVLTATDIADNLPIYRRAVTHRLKGMREAGLVDSRKVGGSAVVWWISDGNE
jgi:DNA-binding transcriptional ArsR family regulator